MIVVTNWHKMLSYTLHLMLQFANHPVKCVAFAVFVKTNVNCIYRVVQKSGYPVLFWG